ncbi:MAG: 6-bladed beta-propeller, partial [Bacteroidales bacterium]|nr:6-bladed beta-propeller [Bacteroidales bacterium]
MKWTAFFAAIIFLVSCNGGPEEVEDTYDRDKFFVVDYNQILNNPQQLRISELNGDVEYIRLETNENCLLHPRADYHFTKDYIFVDNSKFILQFDRSGKFIKQIGKPGRGPGEIGLIRILSVLDKEQLLVVQTNWARKLYFFNYEGEFVENRKVDDVSRIAALPDKRLLLLDGCYRGIEDYMFMLLNSNGDTTDVVYNHYKWYNKTGRVMSVSFHLFYPFYNYGGDTYMKSMYNDTVY